MISAGRHSDTAQFSQVRDAVEQVAQSHADLVDRVAALEKRFAVDPAVQQRLENAQMLSSDLLQKINVIGVKEQEGEKVLISTTGPIARTNSTNDGTHRRNPATVHDLEAQCYRCDQVNYDTAIGYPQLDAWAGHADFQSRINQQISRQKAPQCVMSPFLRAT